MMAIAALGMIGDQLNKLAESHKDDPQWHDLFENLALAVAGAVVSLEKYT